MIRPTHLSARSDPGKAAGRRPSLPGTNGPSSHDSPTVQDTPQPPTAASEAPTLQADTLGLTLPGTVGAGGPGWEDAGEGAAVEDTGAERYVFKGLHARGGLGQIWVAHDPRIGRDVAFKEILPEWNHRPSVSKRFDREARITGRLEHPGIVPVYEISHRPDTRQPFYTMRFVQGRTLSAAIRAHHEQTRAGTASGLDRQSLLTAFVAVANAVHYAHSRGVIHRDLKGDNVILGDFGEVILLDWGIAKIVGQPDDAATTSPPGRDATQAPDLDGPLATLAGQILGTPAYMSPEQACGDVDRIGPHTDVYGLGAILYEILTGRPPFEGTTSAEVLQKVIRDTPPAPRNLRADAPRALEAVCLRALARDPAQRYGSAGDLADEVRRFLADEPVQAWTEPLPVRVRRWARRHRALVTGTAALLVTAVVALSLGTVLLRRKQSEIERQRAHAEDNFRLARRAVDEFLTRMGDSPELKAEGLEALRRQLFGSAREFYQEFAQQRGNDPRSRADLAAANLSLALIQHELGQDTDAEPLYVRSVELYEELAREYVDEPALHRRLCNAISALAQFQSVTGRKDRAEQTFRRMLTLHKARPAAESDPESLSVLADVQDNLGTFLTRARRLTEAEAAHLEGLSIRERLHQGDPGNDKAASSLIVSHVNLIGLYATSGRTDATGPHLRAALNLAERLAQTHPDQPSSQHQLGTALNNIGGVCVLTGRPAEARQAYERALGIREALVRHHPTVREYQLSLASSHINLGELEARQANSGPAIAGLDRGLAVLQGILSQDPRNAMARGHSAYARAWRARALDRAGSDPTEVLAEWERAVALDDRKDPEIRSGRALALARHGQPQRALADLAPLLRLDRLGTECLIEAAEAAALATRGEDLRETATRHALALLGKLPAADRAALLQTPAFASLRTLPEFQRLVRPGPP